MELSYFVLLGACICSILSEASAHLSCYTCYSKNDTRCIDQDIVGWAKKSDDVLVECSNTDNACLKLKTEFYTVNRKGGMDLASTTFSRRCGFVEKFECEIFEGANTMQYNCACQGTACNGATKGQVTSLSTLIGFALLALYSKCL